MADSIPSLDVGRMALYNLDRARETMTLLSGKSSWSPADTASFDCMHYLGDTAIEHAAAQLGLQDDPAVHVLDIGAGFSATGRFLHARHRVRVTGIELQREIHELAELITARHRMSDAVRSVNADFLTLDLGESVDHVVSFLCFLHIPDRTVLFRKVADVLKPGGRVYIEDMYERESLDQRTKTCMRDAVSCPYLPDRETYVRHLETVGLMVESFEDVSAEWAGYVHSRARGYHQEEKPEPSLRAFYDVIDCVFRTGQVGGCRITCVKME